MVKRMKRFLCRVFGHYYPYMKIGSSGRMPVPCIRCGVER